MKLELYPKDLQPYVQAVDAALTVATGLPPTTRSDGHRDRKIYYPQNDGYPTILLNTVGPEEAIGIHPRYATGFIIAPKMPRGQADAAKDSPHIVIRWQGGEMEAYFHNSTSAGPGGVLMETLTDRRCRPQRLETLREWVTLLVNASRQSPTSSG
jgi:hypothetical protein